jgi:hypothetical protein
MVQGKRCRLADKPTVAVIRAIAMTVPFVVAITIA